MIQRTLRIPEELYRVLKREAKSRGITCNALILSILWEVIGNKALSIF